MSSEKKCDSQSGNEEVKNLAQSIGQVKKRNHAVAFESPVIASASAISSQEVADKKQKVAQASTINRSPESSSPSFTPTPKKVGIQLVKCIDTQYVFENVKDSNIKSPIVSPGSVRCFHNCKTIRTDSIALGTSTKKHLHC